MAVKVVMLIIYVLIFEIAMFSNCIFIGVVSRSKDLHTPVFLILSNECVSDLVFLFASIFAASDFIIGKLFVMIDHIICYTKTKNIPYKKN